MYRFLPWFFLLLALLASYFIWQYEKRTDFSIKRTEFETQVREASEKLASTVLVHEHALRGMVSFFDASNFVTAEEYKLFVSNILESEFSYGIDQVGFIKYIDPVQPHTYHYFLNELQQEVQELNQHSKHALVVYVESKRPNVSQENIVNAFDNPVLRNSMDLSKRHNEVFISPTVGVSSENKNNRASLILPVYVNEEENLLIKDPALREIYGWVFVSLNLQAIYEDVFPDSKQVDIRYSLFKIFRDKPVDLLYQNTAFKHSSKFEDNQLIEFNGEEWILYAQSLPDFEKSVDSLFSNANKRGLFSLFVTSALTIILFLVVARLRTFETLKQVNKELELSNERWRFALEGSGDGIWDWDIEKNQINYSKCWREMFGFKADELQGTLAEWESIMHPDDRHFVIKSLNDYLEGKTETYSLENRLMGKDGSWRWMLTRGMIVARGDANKPIRMIGTHTDISELKESEQQVWQHANYDYLTNLPNRRMLYARLEREIERTQAIDGRIALLFLDLDGFKEINDSLGHDQGDVLLQQAGKRLVKNTYVKDTVARLGGDEFIILVSDINNEELVTLEAIAQRILSTLTVPFKLKQDKVFISASMGISIYPDDATTIDDLLKNVDQAMYASKHRGGNCFTYFTPKMQEKALDRLRLSHDLRFALDRSEFFIEYQPIVELQTGDIYKAEALLRWQHAERGLVGPNDFIPIAEDTRLINDIGNWVFEMAIQQCDHWRLLLDERFQIAVNKSVIQFMSTDPQYSNWFAQLSSEPNAGGKVIVEITENLLLEPTEQINNKLDEYVNQGVQIALDDFGTGYSSLSYLKNFKFHYLKMDKTFVANLEQSSEDRVLCKAIIFMAHSLGIKVIAEGIETQQQRDILFDAGCDFGQGYYFSKSVDPSTFEEYVKLKKVSSL